MLPSPNIFRTTGIGCEAKYEATKKRSSGGISDCEIGVFGKETQGKRGITYYFTEKLQYTKYSRGLKKFMRYFGREMEIFPKKGHSEIIWSKKFLPSANSVPSLRPCVCIILYWVTTLASVVAE